MDFGALGNRTGVDCHAIVKQLLAVSRHLVHDNRSGSMLAPPQIGFTILIPERTWILPLCHAFHAVQRRPRSCRISGSRHEQPLVRSAEIDIKEPVVVSYRGSPRTAGISLHFAIFGVVKSIIHIADYTPVDKIVRFKHRHPHEMKL